MTVEPSADDSVEIVVTDTIATVCDLTPSTMTGTGSVNGNDLVVPTPDYTCDDGSGPQTINGPPLNEQLRNLTYVHDPERDILTVGDGVWLRAGAEAPSPTPRASEHVAPPSEEAGVTALLNDFLDARIAGEGAEEYLLPISRDSTNYPTFFPPLLYATTSGARYERAEFEQVLGTNDWPDGATVFKVRLFAGDTMVEQLFFTTDNPDLLRYQAYAYGADFAPTTENGMPVAVPYSFFEGEVTLHAAHPWDHVGSVSARLTPDGPGVRSNGEDIGTWDVLVLMADPAPLTGCQSGPVPADAEALAERIQSDSDLEWTAPVAVSAGGTEALMMDVAFADYTDAGTCDVDGVAVADVPGAVVVKDIGLTMGDWGPMDTWLSYVPEPDDPSSISAADGTPIRMRLYLFDAPAGSSMRTLAITIVAPESSFDRAVEAAAPVVDSIEFDAP